MIGETGIWSEEEQSAHIFSYGVARWVGSFLNKNKTLIDLGCGNGMYCEYFDAIGFHDVMGLEGNTESKKEYEFIYEQDLTKMSEWDSQGSVFCLEVFEHIPPQYESVFVENICRHCSDKLIISVAHEGQQGLGHVNCRPDWYVIELFEGKGFRFLPEETKSIRSCAEGYVAYLRENLFVFTR